MTLTPLKWALTTSTPLMLQQFNGLLRAQGQIAPDPSDPNVIHIVYNDSAQADPAGEDDVEVFYRKLQRNGDNWSLSDRLAVNTNDDPAGLVTDQIRPVVVATAAPPVAGGSTWLHVLFYDDRDFPTQGEMTADAKMHLYYS